MSNCLCILASNQEFFGGGGVFLELGHFDHIATTREKKATQKKSFFTLETLKSCILNETFNPYMTPIGKFFPKIRALFSNFWKRAAKSTPLLPASYAPGISIWILHVQNSKAAIPN